MRGFRNVRGGQRPGIYEGQQHPWRHGRGMQQQLHPVESLDAGDPLVRQVGRPPDVEVQTERFMPRNHATPVTRAVLANPVSPLMAFLRVAAGVVIRDVIGLKGVDPTPPE
jgi:hypothetical protein